MYSKRLQCNSTTGTHTSSAILGESVVCTGDSYSCSVFYQCLGGVSADPDRNTGLVKLFLQGGV